MKRFCLCLLQLAVFLPGFAGVASAQTADEVVEKLLAAAGGRQTLESLKSRKSTGTVTISTMDGDFTGTIETYVKAPNKSRTYMRIDLSSVAADDLVIDQRFDGTAGYFMNSMQGNSEISGRQLENMRNNVFPSVLLNYRDAGVKIELLPNEKVGEKEAIVLLVTPKTGTAAREFLDAQSFLPIKMVAKADAPQSGGEVEQSTEFSDYRDVDGVKIPFRMKVTNPAQTITVQLNKVEHNVTIDDSMFVKPPAKTFLQFRH